MKTCRNCNQELTDDILFCPKCGTKIEDTEAKQETVVETPPEMKQEEIKTPEEKLPEEKPARSQAFWFGALGGGFVAFLILCFLLLQWKPEVAMGALQHGSMILGCLCLSHWWMGRKKKEKRVASVVVGVLFFFLSSAAKEFQPEIMDVACVFSSGEKKPSVLMPLCDDPVEVVIQNINKNLQAMGSSSRIVDMKQTDAPIFGSGMAIEKSVLPEALRIMLDRMGGTTYDVVYKYAQGGQSEYSSILIDSNKRIVRMSLPYDREERIAVFLALHCSGEDIARNRGLIEKTIVGEKGKKEIHSFSSIGYIMPMDKSREIISTDWYGVWAFSPDTWALRTKGKKKCSFDYMNDAKALAQLGKLDKDMSVEDAIAHFSQRLNWADMKRNRKEREEEYRKGNVNDVVREYVRFYLDAVTGKVESLYIGFETPDFEIAKQIAYEFAQAGKDPGMYTDVDVDGMAFKVSVNYLRK